jgi:hypothetical protein
VFVLTDQQIHAFRVSEAKRSRGTLPRRNANRAQSKRLESEISVKPHELHESQLTCL